MNTTKFPLWRIPTDIIHKITQAPGEWIQYGYQLIRFVDGEAEMQSLISGAMANPFLLR